MHNNAVDPHHTNEPGELGKMKIEEITEEGHRPLIEHFYLCQVVVQHFGGKGRHAQDHLNKLRQLTNTLGELGYGFSDAKLPYQDNGTNDSMDCAARFLNATAVKKCVLLGENVIQPREHFQTACNVYIQQLT